MPAPQTDLNADLGTRFTYHPPKQLQVEIYEGIRDKGKAMALHLADVCPSSRELSLAMTKLEECIMWANASIARRS